MEENREEQARCCRVLVQQPHCQAQRPRWEEHRGTPVSHRWWAPEWEWWWHTHQLAQVLLWRLPARMREGRVCRPERGRLQVDEPQRLEWLPARRRLQVCRLKPSAVCVLTHERKEWVVDLPSWSPRSVESRSRAELEVSHLPPWPALQCVAVQQRLEL